MKIYVICQNDDETAIYTPEIFKDEEKALAFLRKEFIDNFDPKHRVHRYFPTKEVRAHSRSKNQSNMLLFR